MMKRTLFFAALLVLLLLCCGVAAAEADTPNIGFSGKCGDNLTWSYSNHTLTIDGSGDMYNYSADTFAIFGSTEKPAPWCDFCDSIRFVEIGASVSQTGNNAFACCKNLIYVHFSSGNTIPFGDNLAPSSTVFLLDTSYVAQIGMLQWQGYTYYVVEKYERFGESFVWVYTTDNRQLILGTAEAGNYEFSSDEVEESGKISSSIVWIHTTDHRLLIIGTGEMENYKVTTEKKTDVPWNRKLISSVIIGNGISRIGDYAFYNCSALTSVTIPDSVTSIGANTFRECVSLTGVTIPDSVTSIGANAFEQCSSLTGVTISNSLTSIGEGAFQLCNSLTGVTIPNSVTSIGEGAFCTCTRLTSVTIPNSVTGIGTNAFQNCTRLTSVTILNSACLLGANVFSECHTDLRIRGLSGSTAETYAENNSISFHALATFTESCLKLPDSVTAVEAEAFRGDSTVKCARIPNGCKSIGSRAFADCSGLAAVYIPSGVNEIAEDAFENAAADFIIVTDAVNSEACRFAERMGILCGIDGSI